MTESKEDIINQRIIEKALERESSLQEEMKQQIALEATIETLEDMTSLSREEIRKITREVRKSYDQEEKNTWIGKRRFLLIAVLVIAGFLYYHNIEKPGPHTDKPYLVKRKIPAKKITPDSFPEKFPVVPKPPHPEKISKKVKPLFSAEDLFEISAFTGIPVKEDFSSAYNDDLQRAYMAKLSNSDYIRYKNAELSARPQHFKQEKKIKKAISKISAELTLPASAAAIAIPLVSQKMPTIDGWLDKTEWQTAVKIPIGIKGKQATMMLLSNGKKLFVSCDALDERTPGGFDQFRFYYHVDISPFIRNERLLIGRDSMRVIRQTTIRWPGDPPTSKKERWKRFPLSDWNIHRLTVARSSFTTHRQYEAMFDIEEMGLHVGVPFPVFVEVETDPFRNDQNKFQGRDYIGRLGSQNAPYWFIIGE